MLGIAMEGSEGACVRGEAAAATIFKPYSLNTKPLTRTGRGGHPTPYTLNPCLWNLQASPSGVGESRGVGE